MGHINLIKTGLTRFITGSIAEFHIIGGQADNCGGLVINLSIKLYATSHIEFGMLVIGIIVAIILIIAHIAESNIASSLDVTYAVFQVRNAYTQIVEFRRELISQAVNHSLLFRIGLVLISHSFGYHLCHFVTSDVILALEGAIWVAVDNAGISQL